MFPTPDNRETRETNESLWRLIASPAIWAIHFLACYATAAIWCTKYAGPDASLLVVRAAIGVYTVVALAGIAATGWSGYQRHRYGTATVPHDFDTPEDRHRFLGFATLLLSGLSGVATLFVALVVLFVETCH